MSRPGSQTPATKEDAEKSGTIVRTTLYFETRATLLSCDDPTDTAWDKISVTHPGSAPRAEPHLAAAASPRIREFARTSGEGSASVNYKTRR